MSSQSQQLKVAVCQLNSVDDVERNVEQILQLLQGLKDVDLVCLPENALFMRIHDEDKGHVFTPDDPQIKRLSAWARSSGVTLHIGSVPWQSEGEVRSAQLLLRPDGPVENVYQKIHLFDVDVDGAKPVRESNNFRPGERPNIIEVAGWRLGCSICYDLRFAELFTHYAKAEVDAILIPSAFLVPTGKAHWHVLTRARAVESQCFVLAAAQGGTHHGGQGGQRATFGHSLVIDPWGAVLAEAADEPPVVGILRATLERDRLRSVRKQIPMRGHRRLV